MIRTEKRAPFPGKKGREKVDIGQYFALYLCPLSIVEFRTFLLSFLDTDYIRFYTRQKLMNNAHSSMFFDDRIKHFSQFLPL